MRPRAFFAFCCCYCHCFWLMIHWAAGRKAHAALAQLRHQCGKLILQKTTCDVADVACFALRNFTFHLGRPAQALFRRRDAHLHFSNYIRTVLEKKRWKIPIKCLLYALFRKGNTRQCLIDRWNDDGNSWNSTWCKSGPRMWDKREAREMRVFRWIQY